MASLKTEPDKDQTAGMIEECIDEIDHCLAALAGYPEAVLALALRSHLANLLRVMQERALCTPTEADTFLDELQQEARLVE